MPWSIATSRVSGGSSGPSRLPVFSRVTEWSETGEGPQVEWRVARRSGSSTPISRLVGMHRRGLSGGSHRAGLVTPLFEMIDVGEQVPGDGLVGVGLMESTSATSWASALLASRLRRGTIGSRIGVAR